jgi:hypothetical protein
MKKLLVLLPIVIGFWIGCFVGAYLEVSLHQFALLIPAGFTGMVGLVYIFFRNRLKEEIKRIEIKRLAKDLHEVDGALARAHSFLTGLRHHTKSGCDKGSDYTNEDGAVVDLDEEVEHALEVVHEMEMTLDELMSEQSHRDRLSPSHKQASQHVYV